MKGKPGWLKVIHVAKRMVGLDDIAYRALLEGAAGVSSAGELETNAQFRAVMAAFERLGFPSRRGKDTGTRPPDMMSQRQEAYIRGLWSLASRAKDEKSLRAVVKRICGVSDIAFLKKGDAAKVILALREMAGRAGLNPDFKER